MIGFDGTITMPPMSGPVSISVPFEFAGFFTYAKSLDVNPSQALLVGGGVATFNLEPYSTGDAWFIRSVTFEFRPRQQP